MRIPLQLLLSLLNAVDVSVELSRAVPSPPGEKATLAPCRAGFALPAARAVRNAALDSIVNQRM